MNARALPLPDASCEVITCFDVLEFVRDDDTLLAECARVLRPGGALHLRVPNAGPVAGIDPLNLYHYLVDITGRRARPPELDEIGWRRHYSPADLTNMLQPWFGIEVIQTHRLGVAALVQTGVLVIGRWFAGSRKLERRTSEIVRRIEQCEDRIQPGQSGWLLTVTAKRRRDED
jgi:SAM-dependent methyltransferase